MTDAPKIKMPYVRLGKSGLKVSKLILGCASYGHKGWANWVIDDEEEAFRHIKYAYDAGIQTFDTANVYSNGLSEVILGKAIKKFNLPREELVIMTKLYAPVAPEYGMNVGESSSNLKSTEEWMLINQRGLNRKHVFDSVKASLARLQLDNIDVLQCHRFDSTTPIDEVMHALHDVVKAGYVRYIGMSSCYAYQFHAMQNYAINNNLTPFISMQNHYNLAYREEEREMIPTLQLFGVGMIPWSPLAAGRVCRPNAAASTTTRGKGAHFQNRYQGAGTADVVDRVEEIAKKKGVSMAQIGISWTLAKPHITAPIIGSTKLENITDALAALQVKLTEEEIKYLEEPYQPTGIEGHT